jgi:hypothetical protein
MFTVDTNPRSQCSLYVGAAFTNLVLDIHLINKDDSSNYSDYISPVDPAAVDNRDGKKLDS